MTKHGLADDIDYLREENAWLRAILFDRAKYLPLEWRLRSGHETVIMAALMAATGILRYEYVGRLMYPTGNEPSNLKATVNQVIHRIRGKILRFDIHIVTHQSVGYSLQPNGKEIAAVWLEKQTLKQPIDC